MYSFYLTQSTRTCICPAIGWLSHVHIFARTCPDGSWTGSQTQLPGLLEVAGSTPSSHADWRRPCIIKMARCFDYFILWPLKLYSQDVNWKKCPVIVFYVSVRYPLFLLRSRVVRPECMRQSIFIRQVMESTLSTILVAACNVRGSTLLTSRRLFFGFVVVQFLPTVATSVVLHRFNPTAATM